MKRTVGLLLSLMAGLLFSPLLSHADPAARRPVIHGLPPLAELQTTRSPIFLTFKGLRGVDRITIRRDDRIIGSSASNSTGGNAILFRGTLRRSKREVPVAADLIGTKFTLRYLDPTGRPVSLRIPRLHTTRTVTAQRTFRPKRSEIPCASPPVDAAMASESSVTAAPASSFLLPLLSPVRTLDLAVYGDYELRQAFGSSAEAELQAIINAVNAIFENQLGISLRITGMHIFDSGSPLQGISNPDTLLEEFRDAVDSDPALPKADGVHLFTGKNLKGAVVGLSYIGVVCRTPKYSFGLSERVSDAIQPLITAHELAHSLNAKHTKAGGGIMSPTLYAEFDTFTGQSLTEIFDFVNGNGSCLSYQGASVSLSERQISGNRLAVTATVRGSSSSGCTLALFGSQQRPGNIGRARTGKKIYSKVLTTSGKTRWNIPLSGSGAPRKFFLTATVECPGADDVLIFGASQPLAIMSSNRAFLNQLTSQFNQ